MRARVGDGRHEERVEVEHLAARAADVADVRREREASARGLRLVVEHLDAHRAGHLRPDELDDSLRLLVARLAHHEEHRHVEHVGVFEQVDDGGFQAVERAEEHERHEVVDDEPLRAVLADERHEVAHGAQDAVVLAALVRHRRRDAEQLDEARLVGAAQVEADRCRLDHQVFRALRRDEQARLAEFGAELREAQRQQVAPRRRAPVDEVRAAAVEAAPRAVDDLDAAVEKRGVADRRVDLSGGFHGEARAAREEKSTAGAFSNLVPRSRVPFRRRLRINVRRPVPLRPSHQVRRPRARRRANLSPTHPPLTTPYCVSSPRTRTSGQWLR